MISPALRMIRRRFGIDRYDPLLGLYVPLWYSGYWGRSTFNSLDINRHVCTVSGMTWGPNGGLFDKIDDFIALPGSPFAKSIANVNTYTVWAWVRTTDYTANQCIYSERTSATANNMILIGIESSVWIFYHRDNATNMASSGGAVAPVNNAWTFIVAERYAADSFEFFVNNVSTGTSTTTVGVTTVTRADIGRIMEPALIYPWGGNIREVGIIQKALNVSERGNLMQATGWWLR